jgi:hypothetical protein
VALTPEGEAVLAAIYARDQEWSSGLLAKLDQEQLVAIASALESIAQILEAYMDHQPTMPSTMPSTMPTEEEHDK